MDIFSGIILGTVQGLTEFLPISSTGHLIIVRDLLGLKMDYGLSFDAVLHFATAGAVFVYFSADFFGFIKNTWLWLRGSFVEKRDKQLIAALLIGTIPAVLFGLALEKYIETTFRSVNFVAWGLIVGSILFLIAEYYSKKIAERGSLEKNISVKNGLIIGFFQTLALVPGMSRSGATISGGLLLGLSREEATRFAFLLSFPIIVGAGSKSVLDLGVGGVLSSIGPSLIAAILAAFISGMFAIHFLLKYLKTHTLNVFVFYRLILAAVILIYISV